MFFAINFKIFQNVGVMKISVQTDVDLDFDVDQVKNLSLVDFDHSARRRSAVDVSGLIFSLHPRMFNLKIIVKILNLYIILIKQVVTQISYFLCNFINHKRPSWGFSPPPPPLVMPGYPKPYTLVQHKG